MNEVNQHPLQGAWDLAGAQVKAGALEAALNKGVFEILQSPLSSAAFADQLSLDTHTVTPWLELLWSMGYLLKSHSVERGAWLYQVSTVTRRYLLLEAEQSCVAAVKYRLKVLRSFGEQFESMLKPSSAHEQQGANLGEAWAQAAKSQIFEEQRAVTVPACKKILETIPELSFASEQPVRCLDLGAGAGLVSVSLMERYVNGTGVAFDFPATIDVLKQQVEASAVRARLTVQSGDLNYEYPAGEFDFIWCSSVLHFIEQREALLERIVQSLAPGGYLLMLHAEQVITPQLCEQILPFYLPMMMRGHYLPVPGELVTRLTDLGLMHLKSELMHDFPMAPIQLHFYQKEVC